MKLHYMGKYNMNPDSLPHNEHIPNAVPFREAKSTKALSLIANILSIIIIIIMAIPIIICHINYFDPIQLMFGCITPMLFLFPHELLHAICFKQDVYLYTDFKHGLIFVVGNETMSKTRFIFMSLLPNIVFGFIPYIIGIVFPQLLFFAVFGIISTGVGAGDYYNVFNAITQMPHGSRTYIYKLNSFWYLPE